MPFSPLRSRAALALAAALGAFAGCETFRHDPEPATAARGTDAAAAPVVSAAPPGKYATRGSFYVVYHDFEFDAKDTALLARLDPLPEQVFGELKLPPGNAMVEVYLFDTQERYESYMQKYHANLPRRRAYFLSQVRPGGADELKIYTWKGDHITTDLRHEFTHALLRSVLKEVPIWLDEGLAGYFELSPEQQGVNPQHLETLLRSPFRPNLARLETLKQVAEMEKPEYREAWAWVNLMLRSGPAAKKVLHQYLQALRTNPNPGPLLPRLNEVLPDPEQALVDHLASIEMPKPRPQYLSTGAK
jgi:hypothetical protein